MSNLVFDLLKAAGGEKNVAFSPDIVTLLQHLFPFALDANHKSALSYAKLTSAGSPDPACLPVGRSHLSFRIIARIGFASLGLLKLEDAE